MPYALSDLEVRHLLNCVTNPVHKVCLTLMYACGLRISEAVAVDIQSINRASMVLKIIGKCNKERHIPLPQPMLRQLVELWRTHRHPEWLFPNKDGSSHIAAATLSATFAKAALAARMTGPSRPTSHTLRHSYATRLLENKVELRVVQCFLGHASLRTTAAYTHLTDPTRQQVRVLLDSIMADL